jgi:hypothetical protein
MRPNDTTSSLPSTATCQNFLDPPSTNSKQRTLPAGSALLPAAIPERVLSLAVFFGAIVAWVTDHLPEGDWLTNVPCRRSPGRRPCRGEVVAELDRTFGHIVWHCPLCGDNGLIHGWEDTPWDRQHDAGTAPTSTSPATTH